MSTLYIRLPSKAAAEAAELWTALPCPFAQALGGGIERVGIEPLSGLSEMIRKAQRVVLLLAASDVSLLRIQVPPLSPARLKAALPNLVEDQLITDPAECVVVAGPMAEGLRTVAVVQRSWLEIVHRSLTAFGARQLTALPAQLCLPYQAGMASAAIAEQGDCIDVTLRLSEYEGIGLPVMPDQDVPAAHEVIQALSALVPQQPIALYVPESAIPAYQEAVGSAEETGQRISVLADDWRYWIAGAGSASPDLMTGLGGAAGPKINWRPWRWPLALAGLLLLINAAALNIDWWRMRSEADGLRARMNQIYKAAFPKDPVVVDPLAQMRQKIAAAKRDSGQPAPDDFTAIVAAFGEAWATAQGARGTAPGSTAALAIAGLEYRDRSLFVRFKSDAQPPADQVKAALASRDLSLIQAPSQGGAVVWQIRSGK